jgi:hypothetical protein
LHLPQQRELAEQRAGTRDHFGAGAVIDSECAALNHESGIRIVALVEQMIATGDIAHLRADRQRAQRFHPQQAQGRDTLEQRDVILDRHQT